MIDPQSPLRLLVLGSAVIGVAGLAWQGIRTLRFGRRPDPSVPAGSAAAGVLYAFGPGMAPWAKESARAHLPTWFAGVLYHFAIFLALIELACLTVGQLPPAGPAYAIRFTLGIGVVSGLGLFLKRLISPALKPISCPDDYLGNGLATVFIALALAVPWAWGSGAGSVAEPLFMIWGAALLLYIPFGKIRHCFFFFYTRILFGRFFGRRGVLPGGLA